MGSFPSWPFKRGTTGSKVPFHKKIISNGLSSSTWKKFIAAIRAPRKFRIVFYYYFCCYFWGQHWIVSQKQADNWHWIFYFFTSCHCPQHFHYPPCPTAVPASLCLSLDTLPIWKMSRCKSGGQHEISQSKHHVIVYRSLITTYRLTRIWTWMDQWCTRTGFWSPSGRIFGFFGFGLDIVVLSSGFGLSKWKILAVQKSWYGIIVVWGKITIFPNHVLIIYLSDFFR